jgi:hypothetical protein
LSVVCRLPKVGNIMVKYVDHDLYDKYAHLETSTYAVMMSECGTDGVCKDWRRPREVMVDW